jgi:hypothetical protein
MKSEARGLDIERKIKLAKLLRSSLRPTTRRYSEVEFRRRFEMRKMGDDIIANPFKFGPGLSPDDMFP